MNDSRKDEPAAKKSIAASIMIEQLINVDDVMRLGEHDTLYHPMSTDQGGNSERLPEFCIEPARSLVTQSQYVFSMAQASRTSYQGTRITATSP